VGSEEPNADWSIAGVFSFESSTPVCAVHKNARTPTLIVGVFEPTADSKLGFL
jgi:hypothetical protein